jgi:hypothetical protein
MQPGVVGIYDDFSAAIRSYLEPDNLEQTQQHLREYYYDPTTPFTGSQFELIADRDCPNEITARDLVAVSMLGVAVPADVAVWILSEDGRRRIGNLLEQVPADAIIGRGVDHLRKGGAMWQLWDLLDVGCWPAEKPGNGMGPTTKSKVLAAKRPALVPINDSVVRGALPEVDNWWAAFTKALDDETILVASILLQPRPEQVPILRALDVAIWQANRKR